MWEPDLRGKTALVTGGGRGIGREVCFKLARCGARVIVTARHPEEIDEVAREIAREGGDAHAVPCDVSRDSLVERLFDASGPIDILINNAGTVHPIAPVVDANVLQWEQSIAVNLTGVFLTCHYALPHMLESNWGRIVNVSSGAARGSVSNWSAYSAGKAGVEALTKILAKEMTGTGIRVNAMRPGKVDTDMQVEIRASSEAQFGRENLALYRGFKERGDLRPPEQPARLILWMLSDEADGLNGEVLVLDDPETAAKVGLDAPGR